LTEQPSGDMYYISIPTGFRINIINTRWIRILFYKREGHESKKI